MHHPHTRSNAPQRRPIMLMSWLHGAECFARNNARAHRSTRQARNKISLGYITSQCPMCCQRRQLIRHARSTQSIQKRRMRVGKCLKLLIAPFATVLFARANIANSVQQQRQGSLRILLSQWNMCTLCLKWYKTVRKARRQVSAMCKN